MNRYKYLFFFNNLNVTLFRPKDVLCTSNSIFCVGKLIHKHLLFNSSLVGTSRKYAFDASNELRFLLNFSNRC